MAILWDRLKWRHGGAQPSFILRRIAESVERGVAYVPSPQLIQTRSTRWARYDAMV
jgi:hypothetical protein